MTEGTEKATSLNLSDLSLYLHSLYHDKFCICTHCIMISVTEFVFVLVYSSGGVLTVQFYTASVKMLLDGGRALRKI